MKIVTRMNRATVGVAAAALVLAAIPPGVALAGTAEVCANAPDAGFPDAAATGAHTPNIDCMTAYRVGGGRADGSYGVFADLTRGQAATLFVQFAVAATDGAILADVDNTLDVPFVDVVGTTHAANIATLYRLRLIGGTTSTTFSPNAPIGRGQFATILRNVHVAFGITVADGLGAQFADVAGTTHEEAINQLAALDIIGGFNDNTYRPSDNVKRGATATLLARSAGVLDDAGLWFADRLPVVVPGDPSDPDDADDADGPTLTSATWIDSGVSAATRTIFNVEFTAVRSGASGNDITVEYAEIDDGPLTVEVSGNAIKVFLEFDTFNAIWTTSATQVEWAVNAHAAASALVVADAKGSTSRPAPNPPVSLQGGESSLAVTLSYSEPMNNIGVPALTQFVGAPSATAQAVFLEPDGRTVIFLWPALTSSNDVSVDTVTVTSLADDLATVVTAEGAALTPPVVNQPVVAG